MWSVKGYANRLGAVVGGGTRTWFTYPERG